MSEGIIIGETGAQRLIGYVLDVSAGDGRARCRLTVGEEHANRHGVMHGGIIAAILDNALGATASLTVNEGGRTPFLTISMTTQFLAPAKVGMTLEAIGRRTGGGRSMIFVEGQVTDNDGTLIATATGVFKKVPSHRLSEIVT